jgi:hypothetical protein
MLLPEEANEYAKREALELAAIFVQHDAICHLAHGPWQENVAASNGPAKLIFCDPYYGAEYQPTGDERKQMRKLVDDMSVEGTVILVFGRPKELFKYWEPLFEDGLSQSKVKWHVDSSLFIIQRSKRRDKHTHNFRVWHSMTEYALTITRKIAGTQEKICDPYNPQVWR